MQNDFSKIDIKAEYAMFLEYLTPPLPFEVYAFVVPHSSMPTHGYKKTLWMFPPS